MTTFNTMILSPVISKLAARLVNVHTTFAAMSAGVCDILPLVAILQLVWFPWGNLWNGITPT